VNYFDANIYQNKKKKHSIRKESEEKRAVFAEVSFPMMIMMMMMLITDPVNLLFPCRFSTIILQNSSV
jgi:hypothetical protein